MVAAVSVEDVVYSRSYYGVPMGQTDPLLAHYLNGVLNSSIATYLVFLTATLWGVDKYEILPNDYLRIPVPRMDHVERQVVERLLNAEERLRLERGLEPSEEGMRELDEAAFDSIASKLGSGCSSKTCSA